MRKLISFLMVIILMGCSSSSEINECVMDLKSHSAYIALDELENYGELFSSANEVEIITINESNEVVFYAYQSDAGFDNGQAFLGAFFYDIKSGIVSKQEEPTNTPEWNGNIDLKATRSIVLNYYRGQPLIYQIYASGGMESIYRLIYDGELLLEVHNNKKEFLKIESIDGVMNFWLESSNKLIRYQFIDEKLIENLRIIIDESEFQPEFIRYNDNLIIHALNDGANPSILLTDEDGKNKRVDNLNMTRYKKNFLYGAFAIDEDTYLITTSNMGLSAARNLQIVNEKGELLDSFTSKNSKTFPVPVMKLKENVYLSIYGSSVLGIVTTYDNILDHKIIDDPVSKYGVKNMYVSLFEGEEYFLLKYDKGFLVYEKASFIYDYDIDDCNIGE